MGLTDKLYDWFARGPAPGCDRALAAALAHAEPVYFERIVKVLLQRQNEASWAGLVAAYDRLPPETRRAVLAQDELVRAGIAITLRCGTGAARRSALAAFEEHPSPCLAYLLVDALCDKSHELREAAARAFRNVAATLWDRLPPPEEGPYVATLADYRTERQHLVQALAHALRKFEHHFCIEVVESGLWFAADLGATLWNALQSCRSRCGYVVKEHLASWNHPRLAAFLLTGLTRPEWRGQVRAILRTWNTAEELTALLRHSHLLKQADIRDALASIKEPWFTQLDGQLSAVPAGLRPQAPAWVCSLGWSDDAKARCLSGWLLADSPEVHKAVVQALATLNSAIAITALHFVADSSLPQAAFARACLAGREGGARRRDAAGVVPAEPCDAEQAEVGRILATLNSPRLAQVWHVCRRSAPDIDPEVLATIRQNLDAWHSLLKTYLRSSDPRDRMLVLWMVSALAPPDRFRRELWTLSEDPDARLRAAARLVLDFVPPPPAAAVSAHSGRPAVAGKPPTPDAARRPVPGDVLRAQRAALGTLCKMMQRDTKQSRAEAIDEFKRLLPLIHGQRDGTSGGVPCARETVG